VTRHSARGTGGLTPASTAPGAGGVGAGPTRRGAVDAVVLGSGVDALVAAIVLGRSRRKVLVLEGAGSLGGELLAVEFAPGFRAVPLLRDAGWVPPRVARAVGLGELGDWASDPTIVAPADGGGWLELSRSVGATCQALRRFSSRDAERWPTFSARVRRLAGFLSAFYVAPPPRIDSTSLGELGSMLQLGTKLRGLGKTEMIELLRTVPMAAAEWLDEWFEGPVLKGALAAQAVTDLCQGPMSGGTAFTLLHHQVGSEAGVFGSRPTPKGGLGAFLSMLLGLARRAGVELRAGAGVRSIVVRGDRVGGVVLGDGEEIPCRDVISTADPYRTLLELLDPVHLDPELILAVRNIRFRGAAAKVLVALDGLPPIPGVANPEHHLRGQVSLTPSIRDLERAYDATKYGRISERPLVLARFPSLTEPELAPAGKQVAVLHLQYAPHRLRDSTWDREREALGDRAIRLVDEALPGFANRVLHRAVLAPPDLEREFGLREGAAAQGELMLDQILFMRPVAGWARSATPMPGLFLAGPGTHPGPGITGASGWLAARAVLRGR